MSSILVVHEDSDVVAALFNDLRSYFTQVHTSETIKGAREILAEVEKDGEVVQVVILSVALMEKPRVGKANYRFAMDLRTQQIPVIMIGYPDMERTVIGKLITRTPDLTPLATVLVKADESVGAIRMHAIRLILMNA